MINDEYNLISSLDKQLQIYRQLVSYLNELAQMKEQLNLLTLTNQTNQQGIHQFHWLLFLYKHFIGIISELLNTKTSLTGKCQQAINLNDLCTLMNTIIQQRINQLRFF
jgi:hypothetical protein